MKHSCSRIQRWVSIRSRSELFLLFSTRQWLFQYWEMPLTCTRTSSPRKRTCSVQTVATLRVRARMVHTGQWNLHFCWASGPEMGWVKSWWTHPWSEHHSKTAESRQRTFADLPFLELYSCQSDGRPWKLNRAPSVQTPIIFAAFLSADEWECKEQWKIFVQRVSYESLSPDFKLPTKILTQRSPWYISFAANEFH